MNKLHRDSKVCPHCNANLQGEPIPEKHREAYGNHTHYSRLIGIYSYEKDRTIAWRCPDCGQKDEC